MTPTQLEEERRRGRYAAAAAFAAAVLFPAGVIWAQVISRDRPKDNDPAELRFYDEHVAQLLASSVLTALAFVCLVVVALHVYRAVKARHPQFSPALLAVGIGGPLALAIASFANDVYLAVVSADFAGRETQSVEAAEDLTSGPFVVAVATVSGAGTLALGFWFVISSLNAMRLGLFGRALGIVGVVIGPALVVGFAPFLITFWLLALAALFLGRWPGGLPLAWERGEAVEWPSLREEAADMAEATEQADGSRNGDVEAVGPGVRTVDAGAGSRSRGRRKRKRRG